MFSLVSIMPLTKEQGLPSYAFGVPRQKNEPEDESSNSLWILPVTNKPGPQYYITLKY